MRATVWVRKHNEEFWKKVTDKSEFVNQAIERDQVDQEQRQAYNRAESLYGPALKRIKKSSKRGE